MSSRAATLAAAVCPVVAACWHGPAGPGRAAAIPGAVWQSAPKPLRYGVGPNVIALDGHTGLISIGTKIQRVDLATGAVLAEREVRSGAVAQIIELRDGRWLVAGATASAFTLAALDPRTLALTPLPLVGGAAPTGPVRVAVALADGRAVLAGPGLPLAVYDTRTWAAGPPLLKGDAWADVVVDAGESAVYLTQPGPTLRVGTDGTVSTLSAAALNNGHVVAASHGVIVTARVGSGEVQVSTPSGARHVLAAPVDAVALSSDGTRVATVGDGRLIIRRVAGGEVIASVDLGDAARGGKPRLVFGESAIAVANRGVVRAYDLATGTTSPDGGPPYGVPDALAVQDDGRVLAVGARAWAIDPSGQVRGGAALAPRGAVALPTGEVERVPRFQEDAAPQFALRDAARGGVVTWFPLEASGDDAWVGPTGEVAVLETSTPRSLWVTERGALTRAFYLADDAAVADADPVAGLALLTRGGQASVVSLRDGVVGAALPVLGCEESGDAGLERGGARAFTAATDGLLLWDRVTGRAAGSLALPAGVFHVAFVPHHDELVVETGDGLALWAVAARQVRTLPMAGAVRFAVSPDGGRLAMIGGDGGAALVDLDVVRATVAPTAAEGAPPPPATCPGGELFAPPPEPEPGLNYDGDGWDGVP